MKKLLLAALTAGLVAPAGAQTTIQAAAEQSGFVTQIEKSRTTIEGSHGARIHIRDLETQGTLKAKGVYFEVYNEVLPGNSGVGYFDAEEIPKITESLARLIELGKQAKDPKTSYFYKTKAGVSFGFYISLDKKPTWTISIGKGRLYLDDIEMTRVMVALKSTGI